MPKSFKLKVTQEVFDQVHTLKSVGRLSGGAIAKITKLSPATIGRITRAKTLEDYKRVSYEASGQAYRLRANPKKTNQEDLTKVLINLTDAIVSQTNAWHSMEEKLDEVLETKRPWMGRIKG